MKKRKLLTWSEGKVDQILKRRLPDARYRVLLAVRLSDTLGPERNETLPDEEFQFLSRAHLDFLIVTNTRPAEPVLAVEFDGPHHDNLRQRARDALKNRLCKKAELPLLRIRAPEIEEWDQITVLDYMLSRFIAWERESNAIIAEIQDYAASLDPSELKWLVSESDPSLDPTFEFNLRHPFPATKEVQVRLLHRHHIANLDTPRTLCRKARLICSVTQKWVNGSDDNGYLRHSLKAVVTPMDSREQIVFSTVRTASIRAWLPTDTDIPSTKDLPCILDCRTDQDLANWKRRMEGMWFPSIPGVSTWDIAENFAEYLAFKAVETWAEKINTTNV